MIAIVYSVIVFLYGVAYFIRSFTKDSDKDDLFKSLVLTVLAYLLLNN